VVISAAFEATTENEKINTIGALKIKKEITRWQNFCH